MKNQLIHLIILFIGLLYNLPAKTQNGPQVKVGQGTLEGYYDSGIFTFKGIPYAAPPTGAFRWREPQPLKPWTGVKKAVQFGPRAMQRPIFGDMNFRSDGMSEDCLYLNVWTPAVNSEEKLPVLVYFYGGGLMAGDGSEPRYDGESMARKGIVSVTVNYRLNVFGFFAHPELTKESPNHASGNYGFLDQLAALQWVKQNIAAFGGDPAKVTIAGESAGSFSVSAQMASPLTKGLFRAAIGESGAMFGNRQPAPLAEVEQQGEAFAKLVGAKDLNALRALSAQALLEATAQKGAPNFSATLDGHFLPALPEELFKQGKQSMVPLLVGWNSGEGTYEGILGKQEPTVSHYREAVHRRYGEQADALLTYYQANTDEEVKQVATDLVGDQFIAYSTWQWAERHSQTSNQKVYRYFYARPRPAMRPEMGNAVAGLAGGIIKQEKAAQKAPAAEYASHSAEIEYALGNLPSNRVYDWEADDYKVSTMMQDYFVNFIKNLNPNGLGLPEWPAVKKNTAAEVMHIDVETKVQTEQHRNRYLQLEGLLKSR